MDGERADARAALERYQLYGVRETGTELGRGSFASVVEVDYKGMRCAGKKIHPILSEPGEGDRHVGRFEEECRLLGALRHPHVVQFLGIFFDPKTNLPVLVMEFLPVTLAKCLDNYRPAERLPEEVNYAILRDVALGLRYLHEQRPPVIHRDLSANNVLLAGDMSAKISDLGVAKILRLSPEQMSRMTRAPGTISYMPPEALGPDPRYDVTIDVFSFGVMTVHVLSGQWPLPIEATRVDPHNPIRVIGLSEAERRAEYLDTIGRGHPLMRLIELCLSNDPSVRPTASILVEHMKKATAQHLKFSNGVEMMRRITSNERQKEELQMQVEKLEREVAATKHREVVLSQEVEQLQIQVVHLEAEKRHLTTSALSREQLLQAQLKEKDQLNQLYQAEVEEKDRRHQAESEERDRRHQAESEEKDRRHQAESEKKDRRHQAESEEKDKRHQAESKAKGQSYQAKLKEKEHLLQEKEALLQERKKLHQADMRELNAKLEEKEQQHKAHLNTMLEQQKEQLHAKHTTQLQSKEDQLQAKDVELSSQNTLISQSRTTIEGLESQLQLVKDIMTKNTPAHLLSSHARLIWEKCAPMPVRMCSAQATVISGQVYVGGGDTQRSDEGFLVCKYDPIRKEWSTLPPAPVKWFGVGQLNRKLVLVGGQLQTEKRTADIHVFEADSQQWEKSIPAMPHSCSDAAILSHKSLLVVCGGRDDAAEPLARVAVYDDHDKQWSSSVPLPFAWWRQSSVVIQNSCFLAGGYGEPSSATGPSVISVVSTTFPSCSTLQELPRAHSYIHSSIATADGSILLVGGGSRTQRGSTLHKILASWFNRGLISEIHAYCPNTSSWSHIGNLPVPTTKVTTATLLTGELLVMGGESSESDFSDTVFMGSIKIDANNNP